MGKNLDVHRDLAAAQRARRRVDDATDWIEQARIAFMTRYQSPLAVAPPQPTAIYRNCEFMRVEIMQAVEELETLSKICSAAARVMSAEFNEANPERVACAAAQLRCYADDVDRKIKQVGLMSQSMNTIFRTHLARSRV